MGAAFLAEMQAGGDHFCVVKYHQRLVRKEFREFPEDPFAHFLVLIDKQLGRIALCQRIFGNPILRQMVVIIFYLNINLHLLLNFTAQK